MDIKVSTLGDITDAPEAQEQQAAPVELVQEQVADDVLKVDIPSDDPAKEDIAVEEENTSNINIDFPEENPSTEIGKNVAENISWEDAIKKVDKKVVAKAMGLSDFAIEMDEYIAKGGKPSDYLNAKAVDYTKISDSDLIKEDLRRDMNLSPSQLERWIEKTYNQGEFADEDDKEFGLMKMQADANKIRSQKIAQQQSFKIPESPINVTQQQFEEQQQAIKAQEEAEAQRQHEFFTKHEATQSLLNNKRVVIDLGEGNKPFNINLDKPEMLLKVMLDNNTWQRITSNEKGEPNVALLQKLAVVALDKDYEKKIYNAGKQAGQRGLLEEGQNAAKPKGGAIVEMKPDGFVVKGTGKIGSH